MAINSVYVVGSGLMGSGIAQVAAQGGFKVAVYDVNPAAVQKAMAGIEKSLFKFASKGKFSKGDAEKYLASISTSTSLEDAAGYDLVVEAVFEDVNVKQDIFRKLDQICKPEAILATNTSAIAISKIASVTGRPDKVVGMHFFSPVPLMKLVEIVSGIKTSRETMDAAVDAGVRMGKEPVRIVKDFGGFIVNRVYLPYIVMSLKVLTEGVATVDDIDKAVKLGLGYPMGPFELGDMVGWDIMFNAINAIYEDTNDPAFAAPPLLKRMVDGGILGSKTGAGFYLHDQAGKRIGVNNNISL